MSANLKDLESVQNALRITGDTRKSKHLCCKHSAGRHCWPGSKISKSFQLEKWGPTGIVIGDRNLSATETRRSWCFWWTRPAICFLCCSSTDCSFNLGGVKSDIKSKQPISPNERLPIKSIWIKSWISEGFMMDFWIFTAKVGGSFRAPYGIFPGSITWSVPPRAAPDHCCCLAKSLGWTSTTKVGTHRWMVIKHMSDIWWYLSLQKRKLMKIADICWYQKDVLPLWNMIFPRNHERIVAKMIRILLASGLRTFARLKQSQNSDVFNHASLFPEVLLWNPTVFGLGNGWWLNHPKLLEKKTPLGQTSYRASLV